MRHSKLLRLAIGFTDGRGQEGVGGPVKRRDFQTGRGVCGLLISSATLMLLAGCSSAVSSGSNTALDSTDLVAMTDDMAKRIETSPAVLQAISQNGPLKIVVEKVVNQMRAEVLPEGPADLFTARVRTLIARHEPDRFTWIMNKDAFYKLRARQLEAVNLGPAPEAVQPQYQLVATFTSLADENGTGRTDYYVCNYSLNSLQDRSVLWTNSYEVKKRAVKGFLD